MKTAKSKKIMTRSLIKFSNYSVCVTLPKHTLEELEWRSGEQVYITPDFEKRTLIISKDSRLLRDKNNPDNESRDKNNSKDNSTKLRW